MPEDRSSELSANGIGHVVVDRRSTHFGPHDLLERCARHVRSGMLAARFMERTKTSGELSPVNGGHGVTRFGIGLTDSASAAKPRLRDASLRAPAPAGAQHQWSP